MKAEPAQVGTCQGGNTKPLGQRARKWCFTFNNYSEAEYNDLKESLTQQTQYFIIGKETGKEGTPHLQGYIEFKHPRRLSTLKELNKKIHWEITKGSKEKNIIYCSKDNNYYIFDAKLNTIKYKHEQEILNDFEKIIWKDWQKNIIDLCNTEPHPRKIYWIVDKIGNSGKSFLCKYLYLKHKCIIGEGKSNDIFNQINNSIENNNIPKLILIDSPRSHENFINYSGIEKIKNGLIYSGKYEGGVCCFKNPHIIIFANHNPDKSKFSEDRWEIINVNENLIED